MKATTVRKWIRGLIGGAIGGAASGVAAFIADAREFNLASSGGVQKLLFVVGVSAGVGAALYLKQHPLPEDEEWEP